MNMDWSTFALEILNFLILVWILQHFFYKPVRQAIVARQQGIEKTLTEAKEAQAAADVLKSQYEKRLADWEAEKQTARNALQAEMSAERKRQLTALQDSLAQERNKSKALEDKRLAETAHQNELAALQQGAQFATQLLERVASASLNERLVEMFTADFKNLPQERRDLFQRAKTATIASAFSLKEKQRTEVIKTLGQKAEYAFIVDLQLIAGLRISTGAHVLQANIQDELKFFTEAWDDGRAA